MFTVKTRETKMSSCQVANRTVTGSAYSLAKFRCFLYRGEIWAEHIKKCIRIGLQKTLNPVNWSAVSFDLSNPRSSSCENSSRRAPAGADGAFLLCAKLGKRHSALISAAPASCTPRTCSETPCFLKHRSDHLRKLSHTFSSRRTGGRPSKLPSPAAKAESGFPHKSRPGSHTCAPPAGVLPQPRATAATHGAGTRLEPGPRCSPNSHACALRPRTPHLVTPKLPSALAKAADVSAMQHFPPLLPPRMESHWPLSRPARQVPGVNLRWGAHYLRQR